MIYINFGWTYTVHPRVKLCQLAALSVPLPSSKLPPPPFLWKNCRLLFNLLHLLAPVCYWKYFNWIAEKVYAAHMTRPSWSYFDVTALPVVDAPVHIPIAAAAGIISTSHGFTRYAWTSSISSSHLIISIFFSCTEEGVEGVDKWVIPFNHLHHHHLLGIPSSTPFTACSPATSSLHWNEQRPKAVVWSVSRVYTE